MPDITMCTGEGCALKESCYRHRATPTPRRQSYFAVPPHNTVTLLLSSTTECKHFDPMREHISCSACLQKGHWIKDCPG